MPMETAFVRKPFFRPGGGKIMKSPIYARIWDGCVEPKRAVHAAKQSVPSVLSVFARASVLMASNPAKRDCMTRDNVVPESSMGRADAVQVVSYWNPMVNVVNQGWSAKNTVFGDGKCVAKRACGRRLDSAVPGNYWERTANASVRNILMMIHLDVSTAFGQSILAMLMYSMQMVINVPKNSWRMGSAIAKYWQKAANAVHRNILVRMDNANAKAWGDGR